MNTLVLLEQNGGRKTNPTLLRDPHIKFGTGFGSRAKVRMSGMWKDPFRDYWEEFSILELLLQPRWQVTRRKSIHCFETSSWVEESALPSLYELALEVIANDCFCLVLWVTSPSLLKVTFYVAVTMCHKAQEEDSTLAERIINVRNVSWDGKELRNPVLPWYLSLFVGKLTKM